MLRKIFSREEEEEEEEVSSVIKNSIILFSVTLVSSLSLSYVVSKYRGNKKEETKEKSKMDRSVYKIKEYVMKGIKKYYFGLNGLEKLKGLVKRNEKCLVLSSINERKELVNHINDVFCEIGNSNVYFFKKINEKFFDLRFINHLIEIVKRKKISYDKIIAIGNDVMLNSSKYISLHLKNNLKEDINLRSSTKIIFINTSIGEANEMSRIARITMKKEEKDVFIINKNIYPQYVITDPLLIYYNYSNNKELMLINIATIISNAVESSTTLISSEYSISLSKEAIELIDSFFKADNDIEAVYFLAKANYLGGCSVNESFFSIGHVCASAIQSIKPKSNYGLCLAALLPSIIFELFDNHKEVLMDVLLPILIKDDYDKRSAEVEVKKWIKNKIGIKAGLYELGFEKKDVKSLIEKSKIEENNMFLNQSSIFVDKEEQFKDLILERIFLKSF